MNEQGASREFDRYLALGSPESVVVIFDRWIEDAWVESDTAVKLTDSR